MPSALDSLTDEERRLLERSTQISGHVDPITKMREAGCRVAFAK